MNKETIMLILRHPGSSLRVAELGSMIAQQILKSRKITKYFCIVSYEPASTYEKYEKVNNVIKRRKVTECHYIKRIA